MGIWKDKTRRDWRYSFQFRGESYAGGGHASRREAMAAREKRKEDLKKSPTKTTATAFSDISKQYLDYSERKHANSTYKYKAYVLARFISFHGDLPFDAITPKQIHDYLNSRQSNHNYNAHRKDLSSVWTFAQRQMGIPVVNPCAALEKMPHSPSSKFIPPKDVILK